MNDESGTDSYVRGISLLLEMGIACPYVDGKSIIYPVDAMIWYDGKFHKKMPDVSWSEEHIICIDGQRRAPEIPDPFDFARDYICTYMERQIAKTRSALNAARSDHRASIAFQREATDLLRVVEGRRAR